MYEFYKLKLELFEKALKMKMVYDATHIIRETYDVLNAIILNQFIRPEEAKHRRTLLYEHFQHIAHEYNFHFQLYLVSGKYEWIKWYYDDIRIAHVNGVIKPFKTKNTIKRNPINAALRHEAFIRDGYRCLECGASNQDTSLEVDHIIPVSQGGTDELKNLQTLCMQCNRTKSNRAWKAGTDIKLGEDGI